jgi:ferritin
MFSQILQDEFNEQIKHELYSAYLYLSMSAHCANANFEGFASWLKIQAGEEQAHAMKFYEFILDRNCQVVLQAIDQPPVEFRSMREMFEQVYAHEQKVTARINHLYELAVKENDYPSQVFLQWFVNEQVEEEKNASQILEKIKMVGESTNGLFMLDHRLGKRGEE